ncbi:phosphoglycerate kinase [Verminephrobacter aporrectodeae subsp. tuberculatae]|uniref:Phosphoglycerate kinase n=1 Tax=Verminephrobacter aporrectodeae subsp. tuberculatae TaxID=1110392 RepID=A0ABT3KUA2_9BURK|nr:histidine phosphatase family protein [Verminephrobacter aporrectodeae]MCW5321484.1 phosphoglycerate kinase [Verminephrobacter aporrectodeae subsp. tuberculatae]
MSAPAPPAARLWLVRHAAALVGPGICYGALDLPADATATRSAAARLAAALPSQPRVFHSPLQRCAQLALELQARRPDARSRPDARLREMDFGAWEGRAWKAIGKGPIDAWTAAFTIHAPGGGERLGALLARVSAALQAARQLHAEQGVADVVWITHAGVARCVAWLQAHGDGPLPRCGEWPVAAPGCGGWELRVLA